MNICYYDKGDATGSLTEMVKGLWPNISEFDPQNPHAFVWKLAFLHIDESSFADLLQTIKEDQVVVRLSTGVLNAFQYPTCVGLAVNCIKKIGGGLEEQHLTQIASTICERDSAGASSPREQLAGLHEFVPLTLPHHLQALEILLQWRDKSRLPNFSKFIESALAINEATPCDFIAKAKTEWTDSKFDKDINALADSLGSTTGAAPSANLLSQRASLKKALQILS